MSRELIGNQKIQTFKIVWLVDDETFEVFGTLAIHSGAKVDNQSHGYPIYDQLKRRDIIKEWEKRCDKR